MGVYLAKHVLMFMCFMYVFASVYDIYMFGVVCFPCC